jgi:hypothetical protein
MPPKVAADSFSASRLLIPSVIAYLQTDPIEPQDANVCSPATVGKWKYFDASRRITPDSIVTVYWSWIAPARRESLFQRNKLPHQKTIHL